MAEAGKRRAPTRRQVGKVGIVVAEIWRAGPASRWQAGASVMLEDCDGDCSMSAVRDSRRAFLRDDEAAAEAEAMECARLLAEWLKKVVALGG